MVSFWPNQMLNFDDLPARSERPSQKCAHIHTRNWRYINHLFTNLCTYLFNGIVAAHLAARFSWSLVQWFGTHRLIRYVLRPSSLNVLARDLKTHLCRRTLET